MDARICRAEIMSRSCGSIHDKLLQLADTTAVIPGHGPATTIGRERERNPFLQGL